MDRCEKIDELRKSADTIEKEIIRFRQIVDSSEELRRDNKLKLMRIDLWIRYAKLEKRIKELEKSCINSAGG